MQVLALDFDGVISDSAREAFAVAIRTYSGLRPGSPLQETEELYAGFVEMMPLGNRAEDYAVILAALEEQEIIADQAAYDSFYRRQDPERLGLFHERFYRNRISWAERDPEGWRRMLSPYPEVLEILHRRASQVTLAIATAKDRRSVRTLLRDYGIESLFREDLVLDKETGVTKRSHLEHLQQSLAVPFDAITFVDDKVNHLRASECGAAWRPGATTGSGSGRGLCERDISSCTSTIWKRNSSAKALPHRGLVGVPDARRRLEGPGLPAGGGPAR
jgi:phosphoglycolate phosphatase-like HAD superfamily hydrolase